MSEPATEKQISFAKSLGIDRPEEFSKTALKEIIDKKLNPGSVPGQFPQPKSQTAFKPYTPKVVYDSEAPQISPVITPHKLDGEHHMVINRIEKPNSYEFGKAGNRHKLYYSEISELQAMIKALNEAGLSADMESFTLGDE
jgi:hypothetical protein